MGKVEDIQRKFQTAQQTLRDAELAVASLEGQQKEAVQRLETDHGVSSLGGAKEKLASLKVDDEKDQKELGEIQDQLTSIMKVGE
jgi:hypothetical protein